MVFRRTHLARLSVGAALLLSGCEGCEVTEVEKIGSAIAVDVCKDPVIRRGDEVLGGVRDCDMALGANDLAVRKEIEIRVTNPSSVDLNIKAAYFTEDSDLAFDIIHKSDTVSPGLTSVWVLGFRPTLESDTSGTFVIESDASNLAEGEHVIIDFTGTGVDNGVPDIEVSPPECDFARVARGGAAICNVQIKNTGERDLAFDEVTITDQTVPEGSALEPGAFDFVGRAPVDGDVIPPASGDDEYITVGVRFTPDVLGGYKGLLVIRTNDPDEGRIVVPLSGEGVDPPTCGIVIDSVNGAPAGPAPSIEPLDDVRLSAEPSAPAHPDGEIVNVEWKLLSAPPGSGVEIMPLGVKSAGFVFSGNVAGVDLAGRYRVRATVYDDLGTESVNECEIEFEAIPTDTILTQLSWDTSFGDMDLHLIKMDEQGRFCGNTSASGPVAESCSGTDNVCYYGNCKAEEEETLDWDADGVLFTPGDPSLDIDDLCGFGPEQINIDVAAPGSYLVGIHYWGVGMSVGDYPCPGVTGSGAVGNTLRIYLYGQLQAEFYTELHNRDWWEVAIIHWPGEAGIPCVEDLSTANLECPDY